MSSIRLETTPNQVRATPRASRWVPGENLLLVLLLTIAVVLRVIMLGQVPPGMQHDEVFDARFATYILDGARPAFIDENTGVPPLFMYLVAGMFSILGRTLIGLRLTAVLVAVLGLIVNYRLLRQLVGPRVALLALAGLAVSFWHTFDSRVGIEPIIVPLMAGLSFYLLWQALRRGSLAWYVGAGLAMGLAQYGHRTGPLIPLTAALFALCLFATRHPCLLGEGRRLTYRRAGLAMGLMFVVAALVATPMALHIANNPQQSMQRVAQLSHDLNALMSGDPQLILRDVSGLLGMVSGVRGDPEWRYNVAGRPIYDPITGLLFWAGLLITLARARQPAYLLLLLWLPINLAMAAVTSPSPASTRAIGSIVPIYTMPAIALVTAWDWAQARQARPAIVGVASLTALLLMGNTAWTVWDYFYTWPSNDEVRSIYRADLATAARYLDRVQPEGTVCMSARFAADLDQQTFDYMLRHKRPVKWFDARRTWVVPTLHEDEPVTYLFPATDPITPAIQDRLAGLDPVLVPVQDRLGNVALSVLRLDPAQMAELRQLSPTYPLGINLGDEIDLMGYDLPGAPHAGERLPLAVHWRVRRGGRGDQTYAFFAHVVDERGFRWAQDDPTSFPPNSWWAGDEVIQYFDLELPADAPPGRYHIDIGFYDPYSGQRLAEVGPDGRLGRDAIRLHPLEVKAARYEPAPADLSVSELVGAEFGGRLTLIGYSITNRILNLEDRTEVALTWRAEDGHARDVVLELALTDEGGRRLPPIERGLVDGSFPLDEWSSGQIVRDRFWLEHTTEIPRAIYELEVAVRDAGSGERLALRDGGTSVSLGQVFMRGLK